MVGLPSEGFRVSGNALRTLATLIAMMGITGAVVADRLAVGGRLTNVELAVAQAAARDSVRAKWELKFARRQCLVLAIMATPKPAEPTLMRMLTTEAAACQQENR
jgi:hypothetical protein